VNHIRVAARFGITLCLAGGLTVAVAGYAQTRPTERVRPAPEVNAQAVVWRTPRPPLRPQAGDIWVNPKDGAAMVYVPAGEFQMGSAASDEDARANEKPQHRVYLDAYWIDRCPVTVVQYRRFCRASKRAMPPKPFGGWHDDRPIVNVNWHDAAAYARWAGKRLPTEAQWEKAARGTDARISPWGNKFPENNSEDGRYYSSEGETASVGSPALVSPYGASDMLFNVHQWCADWFQADYYKHSPRRNPQGPSSGKERAVRGSNYPHGDAGCQTWKYRCATRFAASPNERDEQRSFRCARAAAP